MTTFAQELETKHESDELRATRRILSAARLVGLDDVCCVVANLCQAIGEDEERAGDFNNRDGWWAAADALEALQFPDSLEGIERPTKRTLPNLH